MSSKALVDGRNKLKTILEPMDTSQRIYILANMRGLSRRDATLYCQNLGLDVTVNFTDANFASVRDFLTDNTDKYRAEVEDLWEKEMHSVADLFRLKMMLKATAEMDKTEERDNIIIKEATKCASQIKKVPGMKTGESMDELILRRHRGSEE